MEDQAKRKSDGCARKLESRFPTMSEEEIADIFVPSSTAKNTQWAVSCFTEWRSARNSAGGAKRLCPVDLLESTVAESYYLLLFIPAYATPTAIFHCCEA